MVVYNKVVARHGERKGQILDIFWRVNQQDFLTELDIAFESKKEVKDDPKFWPEPLLGESAAHWNGKGY